MKNPMTVVAAFGLALGGVFGMIGTVVTQRNLQAASWGIDGVGLVVATALLALKFFRRGNDVVAAGFLVFAIGEGVMLSGTATTLAGSVPSFAARLSLNRRTRRGHGGSFLRLGLWPGRLEARKLKRNTSCWDY